MLFFLLLLHGFLSLTTFALGYFPHHVIKLYEENIKKPNRFAVIQVDMSYEDT